MRARPDLRVALLIVVVLAGFALLSWVNVSIGAALPGGGGLIPYYGAARVYLLQGASPYGAGAANYIGRVAVQEGVRNVGVFNGPFFVLIPFFPMALIEDFSVARAVWMALLELCALGISFLVLQILDRKLAAWRLALFYVFSLVWVHAAVPLVDGDAALISGFALLAAIPAHFSGRERLTAGLLAVSLLKPFTAPLLLVYVLLLGPRRILWGMFLLFAVLTAFSFLLRPSWLLEWGQLLIGRGEWGLPMGLRAVLAEVIPSAGDIVFYMIAGLAGFTLLVSWWSARTRSHKTFLWTAMLTLALTPLTGLPVLMGGYSLMLAPLTLVFLIWEGRWEQHGRWLVLANRLLVLVGLWALLLSMPSAVNVQSLPPIFYLIMPVYLGLALLWGRWWALEPVRLPYEELRRSLNKL